MWMPKDAATWLAIIAVILAVPFNFFSSWAYPKTQNWWAARSRRSLQRRIERLTTALNEMDKHGVSVTEDLMMYCVEKLASLIYWGVNTIVLVLLIALGPLIRMNTHHPHFLALALASLLTLYRVCRDYLMDLIRRLRRSAGPLVKIELETSLAELKTKLAART